MRKLFYNGDILTMESPRPAEAVLTEGERIIAVGELNALSRFAGRHAEIIDLDGGALLPGFVDCHSDFGAVVRRILRESDGPLPRHSARAVRNAVRQAAEAYAARGITVLHGRGMTAETVKLLSHSDLPLPLMAVADIGDYEETKRAMVGARGEMRLCGMSLDLDVTDDGGEATGALAYCDRAVGYALRMAAAEGVSLTARAASAEAVAQLLRVGRAMSRVCPELIAARPVLLDARLLSPTDLESARHLGIVPCFAVDVLPCRGDDYLVAYGTEYTSRLTPLASARRAGVPYTLCEGLARADGVPDPIALLCAAVERKTVRGIVPGACERASVYEALRALTLHGAWRYHAEREWGSIRAGARASLVWLDRSPLGVPTRELGDLRPLATFAAGETISCAERQNISTQEDRVLSVY